MAEFDEEMLNDFIEEAEELLDSIEEDFLSLETQGNNSELINKLFRAVHTIKGTAGFIGLKNIGQVSHAMETLLGYFREGKENPVKVYIDALLQGLDKLKQMISNIYSSDSMDISKVSSLLGNINNQIENGETSEIKEENRDIKVPGIDEKLLEVYISESTSVLDDIDSYLTEYVNSDRSESDFSEKIAGLSVLSGSSKYFGFNSVYKLVEFLKLKMDSLKLKEGKEAGDEIKILFSVRDKLQILIDDVYSSNKEDIDGFIDSLNNEAYSEPTNHNTGTGKEGASPAPSHVKKESIRISVTILDQLMRLAGELVLIRNQQSLQFREMVLEAGTLYKDWIL